MALDYQCVTRMFVAPSRKRVLSVVTCCKRMCVMSPRTVGRGGRRPASALGRDRHLKEASSRESKDAGNVRRPGVSRIEFKVIDKPSIGVPVNRFFIPLITNKFEKSGITFLSVKQQGCDGVIRLFLKFQAGFSIPNQH